MSIRNEYAKPRRPLTQRASPLIKPTIKSNAPKLYTVQRMTRCWPLTAKKLRLSAKAGRRKVRDRKRVKLAANVKRTLMLLAGCWRRSPRCV